MACADVVDASRLTAERQGDQGPGHVAHVDEIAACVEVADDELERVRLGIGQPVGESPEGLRRPAVPGPIAIEDPGDDHLERRSLGQTRSRRQPLAAAVRISRVAAVSSRRPAGAPGRPDPARPPSPTGRPASACVPDARHSRRWIVAQKLPR